MAHGYAANASTQEVRQTGGVQNHILVDRPLGEEPVVFLGDGDHSRYVVRCLDCGMRVLWHY